jgi:hypothetical protein
MTNQDGTNKDEANDVEEFLGSQERRDKKEQARKGNGIPALDPDS